MHTETIQSVKDEADPKPWYNVDIRNGRPEILEDNDGGTDFNSCECSLTGIDGLDASNPSEDAVYAVTEGGKYIGYPTGTDVSEHGYSLRAHLAWYDSEADEFTVLEFVE